MEWIKTIGKGAWVLVGALIGVAVAVKFGIPLGEWTWDNLIVPNAMPLTAAALVTYVVSNLGD
ncbi:MAG: hypothetical protein AAB539_02175 [Patescibacteria group bacterium]